MFEDNTEKVIEGWKEFIGDFKEKIYPIAFQPYGVTLNTALMLYGINKLENSLCDVIEDDNDDWKEK